MNALLALYQLLFPLVGVAVAVKMLSGGRGSTLREGLADLRQRLGRVDPAISTRARGALWVHAASVGELAGAEALLAALPPAAPRIVTTSTAAGRERAGRLRGVDAALLAPMDLLPAVRAFLGALKPRAFVVLETELWPATLAALASADVPFAVANAKLSERSFGRYRLLKPLFGPLLARAAAIAAQTEEDAERFRRLGAPPERVRVCGNIKYDAKGPDSAAMARAQALLERAGWKRGETPVWCAGSTRPGEEEAAVLDAFARARQRAPKLRLILAPRHVERTGEAAAELRRRQIDFRTASDPGPADCLLIDSLGLLGALYAVSDAAFVGGTLAPIGGHNVLEPAAAGVPVLVGPHHSSVAEPVKALRDEGGGFVVQDGGELAERLSALLTDPGLRARAAEGALRAAGRFAGAARRTAEFLATALGL